MGRYIIKRILISIPIIIGITIITFYLLNVVPGDPVVLMMKEHISPDVLERVKAEMNLNDPIYVRYIKFMWGAMHGESVYRRVLFPQ